MICSFRKDLRYQLNEWIEIANISDIHLGAGSCDKTGLKRFLTECIDNNRRIIVGGDLLDAIFPIGDRRYQPDMMDPALHGVNNPLDVVIEMAIDLLKPVAHLIEIISVGNHEQTIIKYHSTDPIKRIVDGLNRSLTDQGSVHVIEHGSWAGILQYRMYDSLRDNGKPQHTLPLNLYYTHGAGGSAPVSKGVIDFARWQVNHEGFHFYVAGHNHNLNASAEIKLRAPTLGEKLGLHKYQTRLVRSASWAGRSFRKNRSNIGWAEMKEFQPQPTGSGICKFRVVIADKRRSIETRAEI